MTDPVGCGGMEWTFRPFPVDQEENGHNPLPHLVLKPRADRAFLGVLEGAEDCFVEPA